VLGSPPTVTKVVGVFVRFFSCAACEDTDPSVNSSVAETFPSEFSFALAMNELEERE
jgi:hypothetical protein